MLLKEWAYRRETEQEYLQQKASENDRLLKTLTLPGLRPPLPIQVTVTCKKTWEALKDTFLLNVYATGDTLQHPSEDSPLFIDRKKIKKTLPDNKRWGPVLKMETADFILNASPKDNEVADVEALYQQFMVPGLLEKVRIPFKRSVMSILSKKTWAESLAK